MFATMDPPPAGSMAVFQPDNVSFSRLARPAFTTSAAPQAPPTFLFVNVGTVKSREEKRQIRAQVMYATHEARRRRGIQGRKAAKEKCEDDQTKDIVRTVSPLQDAGLMGEDPFDSLPVKAFPGMNDLFRFYIDTYPGFPLVDDHVRR
ncbi:hypothetical protein SLS55_000192 [Diplodia seriata]|uniref:Uncharacterized protein n=1 Tax=Diplodia seriata TaxID=420778 RepID=A0ABR3CUI3_9PEZI